MNTKTALSPNNSFVAELQTAIDFSIFFAENAIDICGFEHILNSSVENGRVSAQYTDVLADCDSYKNSLYSLNALDIDKIALLLAWLIDGQIKSLHNLLVTGGWDNKNLFWLNQSSQEILISVYSSPSKYRRWIIAPEENSFSRHPEASFRLSPGTRIFSAPSNA